MNHQPIHMIVKKNEEIEENGRSPHTHQQIHSPRALSYTHRAQREAKKGKESHAKLQINSRRSEIEERRVWEILPKLGLEREGIKEKKVFLGGLEGSFLTWIGS